MSENNDKIFPMFKNRSNILVAVLILIFLFMIWQVGLWSLNRRPDLNSFEFNVYFGNNKFDPLVLDCGRVFAVKRSSTGSEYGMEKEALQALLSGPTKQEESRGFYSPINSGVKILSFEIADKVANVDFDDSFEIGMAGSCKVTAVRAEIESTIEQFGTVDNVVISVNGKTEDVLQP